MAYRYGLLRIPGERPIQRMSRVLDLTPSQREQIGEAMEDAHAKIQQTRRDFQRQRRRIFLDTYIRIHALLTPEQQRKFDRLFVPPHLRAEAEQIESNKALHPHPRNLVPADP
jgi:Spy/CpxP family protein refolding chaperone